MDTSTLDSPDDIEDTQSGEPVDVSHELPSGDEFDAYLDNYKANLPDEPVEKPAEAAPPVEPAKPAEDPEEADDKLGTRFRLKANTPRDVAVFAVMAANKGMSYDEASTQLFGPTVANPAAAGETPPEEGAEGDAPLPDTVEGIDARKKELRAQRKAATAAYDFEAMADLQDKLDALDDLAPVVSAKQAQAATAQQQARDQMWADQGARTAALYPDSVDVTSPLSIRSTEIIAALEANGDPLLDSPEAVLRVTQMAAAELGIAPARAGTPVTRQPATPPVRVRPAAGSANGGATPQANDAVLRAIDAMSLEELAAFNASYRSRQG